jgi:hypothetical protein
MVIPWNKSSTRAIGKHASVYSSNFSKFTAAMLFRFLTFIVILIYVIRRFIHNRGNKALASIPLIPVKEKIHGSRAQLQALHNGCSLYLNAGKPFRLQGPSMKPYDMVVLPWKYLDEFKNLPEKKASFWERTYRMFLFDASNGPKLSAAVSHATRPALKRNLAFLVPEIQIVIEHWTQLSLPRGPVAQPVVLNDALLKIVAGAVSRVFSGRKLCKDTRYNTGALEVLKAIMSARTSVRKWYPSGTYWLAPYINLSARRALSIRRRAAKVIKPIYKDLKKRRKLGKLSAEDEMGILWVLEDPKTGGNNSMQQVADDLLGLGIAGLQPLRTTVYNALCDLVERPELIETLKEEVLTVRGGEGEPWTLEKLNHLDQLSSLLKESVRMRPFTESMLLTRSPLLSNHKH